MAFLCECRRDLVSSSAPKVGFRCRSSHIKCLTRYRSVDNNSVSRRIEWWVVVGGWLRTSSSWEKNIVRKYGPVGKKTLAIIQINFVSRKSSKAIAYRAFIRIYFLHPISTLCQISHCIIFHTILNSCLLLLCFASFIRWITLLKTEKWEQSHQKKAKEPWDCETRLRFITPTYQSAFSCCPSIPTRFICVGWLMYECGCTIYL